MIDLCIYVLGGILDEIYRAVTGDYDWVLLGSEAVP